MDKDEELLYDALRVLRASPAPSAAETERFVARVMRALEAVEAPNPSLWRTWLESRWLLPAAGLATAALFVSLSMSGPETIAPADALVLMGGAPDGAAQLLLAPDPSRPDALLGLPAKSL